MPVLYAVGITFEQEYSTILLKPKYSEQEEEEEEEEEEEQKEEEEEEQEDLPIVWHCDILVS